MSSELSYHLRKTDNLFNIILARRIDKIEKRVPLYKNIDIRNDDKNRKKAYQLFLRLIDYRSMESLMDIDRFIDLICSRVYQESHWEFVGNGFMYIDNCPIYQSKGVSHPLCFVSRTSEGFVPTSKNLPDDISLLVSSREEHFLDYFHEELNALDDLLSEKESIMHGHYTLRDPKTKDLASSIVKYLDYPIKRFQKKEKGFK